MESREERIYGEAVALWREMFHEQPPLEVDGSKLLEIITRCTDEISYERLRSPFLRPSTICGPGQPKADDPSHPA
jgi:hypothetical protein